MKNKIGLLLLIVFLFQGCIIHSLYPLYTAETIILDENIEGFWISPYSKGNAGCPEGLLFEKDKDKAQRALHTQVQADPPGSASL